VDDDDDDYFVYTTTVMCETTLLFGETCSAKTTTRGSWDGFFGLLFGVLLIYGICLLSASVMDDFLLAREYIRRSMRLSRSSARKPDEEESDEDSE
jgi:hypothetical protein